MNFKNNNQNKYAAFKEHLKRRLDFLSKFVKEMFDKSIF